MLGARRDRVRAYASGLDFHLSDEDFGALFAAAAEQGYTAFKIKVGNAELDRDIHRLDLLKRAAGKDATVMIDANESWSPRQTLQNLDRKRTSLHSRH